MLPQNNYVYSQQCCLQPNQVMICCDFYATFIQNKKLHCHNIILQASCIAKDKENGKRAMLSIRVIALRVFEGQDME